MLILYKQLQEMRLLTTIAEQNSVNKRSQKLFSQKLYFIHTKSLHLYINNSFYPKCNSIRIYIFQFQQKKNFQDICSHCLLSCKM